jgi:hypothetical protein
MKKPEKSKSDKDGEKPKSKRIRTTDDLELIKIILEENPPLKTRVLYFLETFLGKR